MAMICPRSAGGAVKMFGFSEGDIAGWNVKMLMRPPDRGRHALYLADYLSTGTRKIIGIGRVTTALHRDGNTFTIDNHTAQEAEAGL
ncbi:MAG: PAS domain S-box protein [Myxococcales bacterium]|nr:PAS domain S-box protein [Sphingomicrobium sp.]